LAIANKPAQMLWPDQINHLNKTFVLICFARREGIAPTCWLTGGQKKKKKEEVPGNSSAEGPSDQRQI